MTDSSALLANHIAVSNNVLFNLKPSSARGRSYRVSVSPINALTFQPSTQMIFNVPCGRKNTYLDINQSYIKYTVFNQDVSSNSFYVDNNASCFINRLDVFSDGNMCETTQSYNQVYSYLMDFQTNPAQKYGLANMYGFSTNKDLSTCRDGQLIGGGQRSSFCMPILSSLVGLGADKALPVGALHSDLRLEFSLEAALTAVCFTAAPTASTPWIIGFAELELTYIELSDEAQHLVDEVTPTSREIYLHGNSWRHYTSILPSSTTGVFSTLVPARFASIRSMVCLPRRSTEISSTTSYSLTSRINPNIATYWWRAGSVLIPSRYVTLWNQTTTGGFSEGFASLQQAFHSLTNPEYAGSIPYSQYNVHDASQDFSIGGVGSSTGGVVALNTGNSSYLNGFAIGTEMEVFAQKSDVLLSGFNSLNSNIFFECQIGVAPCTALGGNGLANTYGTLVGPTQNYTLDFFSNFDVIYVLSNGTLTARF